MPGGTGFGGRSRGKFGIYAPNLTQYVSSPTRAQAPGVTVVPRNVYLDTNNGDDTYNGLSVHSPKATWAAAYALLRDDSSDTLNIALGSAWVDEQVIWAKSGESVDRPLTVTCYDPPQTPGQTARPKFTITTDTFAWQISGVQSYLQFECLHLVGPGGDADVADRLAIDGIGDLRYSSIDDFYFEKWWECFTMSGGTGSQYVTFDKCIFYDLYKQPGIIARTTDFVFTRCLVDKINTTSTFGLGFYGSEYDNINPTIHACAFHDIPNGINMRSGGVITWNLFSYCKMSCSIGGGWEPFPGGVDFTAHHNVVTEQQNGTDAAPWGYVLQNVRSGSFYENIHCNPSGAFDMWNVLGMDASNPGKNASWPHGEMIQDLLVYGNILGYGHTTPDSGNTGAYRATIDATNPSAVWQNVSIYNNDFIGPGGSLLVEDGDDVVYGGGVIAAYGNRFFRYGQGDVNWIYSYAGGAFTTGGLAHWKSITGDPEPVINSASTYEDPTGDYPDPDNATLAAYQTHVGGTPGHAGFFVDARARLPKAELGIYDIENVVVPWMRAKFGKVDVDG